MLKLDGTGLSNVYLLDGFHERRFGDGVAYSYSDVHGLYLALATAIARSTCLLAAAELRFLRKRLELTQEELGTLLDRTGQTVAKWEKEQIPVPFVEGVAIRLLWANRFRPQDAQLIAATLSRGPYRCFETEYVFSFSELGWKHIDSSWANTSKQVCALAITSARSGESVWSTERVQLTEVKK